MDRATTADVNPPMRDAIVDMCVAVLRATEFPDADARSVFENAAQAEAFLDLLHDCRPLPVIRDLIAEVEERHSDGRA